MAIAMGSTVLSRLLTVSLALASCQAHSHVTAIIVDGVAYPGFNTITPDNPEILAAWRTEVDQDGWVGGNDYEHPDIICHINATNAKGYLPVKAGGDISFRWNGWPESHHGPILTYLARCGDEPASCETVNKTQLEFFEVDAIGLVDPTMTIHQYPTAKGVWASDLLIYNNATFTVELPPDIASGFYVLRHEIIALHFARMPALGPQHYPQCINLRIEGAGEEHPEGKPATELYGGEGDIPGLTYDIYASPLEEYVMPGPSMYTGAVPSAIQTPILVSSEATAIPCIETEEA
jgi:hypothetical protein